MPQPPHPANVPRAAYTAAEQEFLLAIERYKREAHRPFPAWHEVLQVLLSLGYRKVEVEPVASDDGLESEPGT